jgi:hypothetical protein
LKNLIVQALVSNIIADEAFIETTLLAVRAFFNALPYTKQNFQNQAERDFIMERLFIAMKLSNEEIRVVAM